MKEDGMVVRSDVEGICERNFGRRLVLVDESLAEFFWCEGKDRYHLSFRVVSEFVVDGSIEVDCESRHAKNRFIDLWRQPYVQRTDPGHRRKEKYTHLDEMRRIGILSGTLRTRNDNSASNWKIPVEPSCPDTSSTITWYGQLLRLEIRTWMRDLLGLNTNFCETCLFSLRNGFNDESRRVGVSSTLRSRSA